MRRFEKRRGLAALAVLTLLGCAGAARDDAGGPAGAQTDAAAPAQDTEAATPRGSQAGAASGAVARDAHYVAEGEPSITLTLRDDAGAVTGTMSDGGASLAVRARRNGAGFAGTIGEGDAMPFTATAQGDRLLLSIGDPEDGERISFLRAGGAAAADAAAPAAGGGRHVVINHRRLSGEELARVEQAYRIRIPDADYWYDRVLGAWGAHGHPTAGFIAPGLDLGGPLAANASGPGTGVFVNGRDLPPADLMALQSITGRIPPGRYFITAQGLAGYEGGPPQWNLAALAAQSGGGGGSHSWQSRITGASGFSDGTTGAVFLPNGGIVSTGN